MVIRSMKQFEWLNESMNPWMNGSMNERSREEPPGTVTSIEQVSKIVPSKHVKNNTRNQRPQSMSPWINESTTQWLEEGINPWLHAYDSTKHTLWITFSWFLALFGLNFGTFLGEFWGPGTTLGRLWGPRSSFNDFFSILGSLWESFWHDFGGFS